MTIQPPTRRSLLAGTAVVVAGAVAGFAIADGSRADDTKSPTTTANGYGPPQGSGGSSGNGGNGGNGGGDVVAPLAEVTGDGVIADGIVLTPTADGGVHGVSATCTHQGCTVNRPQGGHVNCPCHGSIFDAATGRVLRGPATQPLPEIPVSVQGGNVVRG